MAGQVTSEQVMVPDKMVGLIIGKVNVTWLQSIMFNDYIPGR